MNGPRRRPRSAGERMRRVDVRFSDDELDAIRLAAAAPGCGVSVARFVAEAALVAADARPPAPRPGHAPSRLVLAEVMAAVAAVNRVGNNLNQLARENNTTGLRPVGARDAEEQALDALARLAEAAARAAGDAA